MSRIRYIVGAKYNYLNGIWSMSKKKSVKAENSNKNPQTIKSKKITLHAFSIKNNSISNSSSMLYAKLLKKLETSETSKDRCMILNDDDESQERDLISSYALTKSINAIFGTVMRIASSKDLPNISDELLQKKSFSIDDLNDNLTGNICRHHYYFLLEDNYVVTYWSGNRTIKNLQTYIGWLVEDELLEFTPIVTAPPDMKLSDINNIRIQDPISIQNNQKDNDNNVDIAKNKNIPSIGNKALQLNKNVLNYIKEIVRLNDVTSIKDEELSQIISAELLIKFKKKPSEMAEEEYARILGATLKPMSDLDSAIFSTKNNGKIVTGKDLLKTKVLNIDVTENGKISEPALHQEMSKFLNELKKNEKTNN